MTKEEKQLLIKDLSARLPYGVKVCVGTQYDIDNDITDIALLKGLEFANPIFEVKALVCTKTYNGSNIFGTDIEDIKPYLRPMSSMTEEEAITIFKIISADDTEFSSVEVSDNCIEIWDYDYNEDGFSERTVCTIYFEEIVCSMEVLDYILSRHFDVPHWNESENTYKTMIEKGLALEAPDGMYNF